MLSQINLFSTVILNKYFVLQMYKALEITKPNLNFKAITLKSIFPLNSIVQ